MMTTATPTVTASIVSMKMPAPDQRQHSERDVTDCTGHVTQQPGVAGSAGQQVAGATSVQHTDGQPHNVIGEIGAQLQHDLLAGPVQPEMCQRLQRSCPTSMTSSAMTGTTSVILPRRGRRGGPPPAAAAG